MDRATRQLIRLIQTVHSIPEGVPVDEAEGIHPDLRLIVVADTSTWVVTEHLAPQT